jgi:hypothetical protein
MTEKEKKEKKNKMPLPKDKTKVKDWKDKIAKTLKGRRCCMTTEWAKGHTPWNKGIKGTHFSPKTEFKKGQRPKNYMGGLRVTERDGIEILIRNKGRYSYQKDGKQIKVGKYESLARHNYRKAFGEFPKEMIVFHKDGDILNNDIENLELITRKELLKRNSYRNIKSCVICGTNFPAKVKKCKTCSKECRREYNIIIGKEYAKNHREKSREGHRKYREKNREKIREGAKIYREKNRDKLRKIGKKYRDKKNEEYKKFLLENETFRTKELNTIIPISINR